MGIFDGNTMLIKTSEYKVVTMAKMFWRYGMDIYNIGKFVDDKVLTKFKR